MDNLIFLGEVRATLQGLGGRLARGTAGPPHHHRADAPFRARARSCATATGVTCMHRCRGSSLWACGATSAGCAGRSAKCWMIYSASSGGKRRFRRQSEVQRDQRARRRPAPSATSVRYWLRVRTARGFDSPGGHRARFSEQLSTSSRAAYEAAGRAPDKDKQPDEYRKFEQALAEYLVILEVLRQEASTFKVSVTDEGCEGRPRADQRDVPGATRRDSRRLWRPRTSPWTN